jgi:diguanylate cyclase (GGDEF)-like protein
MDKYIAVITNSNSPVSDYSDKFGIDFTAIYYKDASSLIRNTLKIGRPVLIIIDTIVMTSKEEKVISKIRSSYLLVHIPIIMTGIENFEYEKHCFLEWGISDYVPYPAVNLLLGLHAAVHIRSHELGYKDELTGLYNRHYYTSVVTRLSLYCIENRLPISLFMIDIDYFKQYNDKYGHVEGSQTIKNLAITLNKKVPLDGIAARYGGDEFIVLLPGFNEDKSQKIARDLLNAIRDMNVEHLSRPDSKSLVTISIGAITGRSESDEEAFSKALIKQADINLYLAKGEVNKALINDGDIHLYLAKIEHSINIDPRDRCIHNIFNMRNGEPVKQGGYRIIK